MKFGSIKNYYNGERRYGYVLNIKSILFSYENSTECSQLKKWSQHNFPIMEEPLVWAD